MRVHVFSRNYLTTEARIQKLEQFFKSVGRSPVRSGNSLFAGANEYVFHTFRLQKGGFHELMCVPDGDGVDIFDLVKKIDEFKEEICKSAERKVAVDIDSFGAH